MPGDADFQDVSVTFSGPPEEPAPPPVVPPSVEAVNRREYMPVVDEEPEEEDDLRFDWLTEAAIPLAIFGLLGCLLYYLIDLRAAVGGQFAGMLRWVCFWFLLAAIGITRLRVKYGTAALALPYVFGLAATTGLVVWYFTFAEGAMAARFNEWGAAFSLVFNFALVGLIWWTAYKVTRECTLTENVAASLDQGFLADLAGPAPRAPARPGGRPASGPPARHPGRVILWVAAVAVLSVGLGARAMGDHSRFAAHAFWCLVGFVFFALILLTLTNLSAIRMDVRRRRIVMSRSLTPTWIIASLALVLLVTLASSFIPRPGSGAGLPLKFGDRAAWLRDPLRNSKGQGPAVGLGQVPPDGATVPGREAQTTGEGMQADQGEVGQSGAGGGAAEGSAGDAAAAAGGQATGGSTGDPSAAAGAAGGAGAGDQSGPSAESGGTASQSQSSATQEQSGKGPKFKWWWLLLLLLLLALLLYLLWRYRERVKAFLQALAGPFRALWLAWLAFLERLRRMLRLRPRAPADAFADLPPDPFADIWDQRDLAAGMTPAQIVRHVYRAFMALCSLRGHPRPEFQTEFEFLRTVPPRIGLEPDDQKSLTGVYVFATYSPEQIGGAAVEQVRGIWSRLRPSIDSALALQNGKATG
jgi:hypothetical protein